jgi:hypothetical protein
METLLKGDKIMTGLDKIEYDKRAEKFLIDNDIYMNIKEDPDQKMPPWIHEQDEDHGIKYGILLSKNNKGVSLVLGMKSKAAL